MRTGRSIEWESKIVTVNALSHFPSKKKFTSMIWSENIQDVVIWGWKRSWGKALLNPPVKPTKHPLKNQKKSIWIRGLWSSSKVWRKKQIDVCHCGRVYFITQISTALRPRLGSGSVWRPLLSPRNCHNHRHLVFERSHVLGGPQQKLWRQWISCNHGQPESCVELHPVSALHIENFTA